MVGFVFLCEAWYHVYYVSVVIFSLVMLYSFVHVILTARMCSFKVLVVMYKNIWAHDLPQSAVLSS
jgi:hypothetical protein